MEECDLATQWEDYHVKDHVAVQRLVHGLVVWDFGGDIAVGDP